MRAAGPSSRITTSVWPLLLGDRRDSSVHTHPKPYHYPRPPSPPPPNISRVRTQPPRSRAPPQTAAPRLSSPLPPQKQIMLPRPSPRSGGRSTERPLPPSAKSTPRGPSNSRPGGPSYLAQECSWCARMIGPPTPLPSNPLGITRRRHPPSSSRCFRTAGSGTPELAQSRAFPSPPRPRPRLGWPSPIPSRPSTGITRSAPRPSITCISSPLPLRPDKSSPHPTPSRQPPPPRRGPLTRHCYRPCPCQRPDNAARHTGPGNRH
jgi:hypothetical protein